MQTPTVTAEDVARLAMVSRQAVTNWRRRPNSAAGRLPFPQAIERVAGVERFAAYQIVAWLEATGRGRNPEVRADAPAFAMPEGLVFDEVVTMLALRALVDGDLAGLSLDELANRAVSADPHDDFLRSEVAAIGANGALTAYVDDLHESAFGLVDALHRAEQSRLGRSGRRGLAEAAIAALRAIVAACRTYLGGDSTALDPRLDAATARRLAHGFAGVTAVSSEAGARVLRRQLVLADIDLVRDPCPTVRVLSVVGERDDDALQAIDDVVLDLAPTDVAVILGPSSLLCDALRGQLDAQRADTLSGGGLMMAVRLPRGLWTNAHRQQLGLWIVAGAPLHKRVVVADLTSEQLDLNDLASDATAALKGDAARSFRYGRAVDRLELRGRRPLVPAGIRATHMGDAAHVDHHDRIVAATLVTSEPLMGFDLDVGSATQVMAVIPTSLGELVASRRISLIRGTRVDTSHTDPAGTVRALSADPAIDELLLDPLEAVRHYPQQQRTEPGDVVFVDRPRPLARVDTVGGALPRFPSRALRLLPGAGIGPHALAAVFTLMPADAGEWRTWNIPLLGEGEVPAMEHALTGAVAYLAELQRRETATRNLIASLIQGAAAGTVTLTPTATTPTTVKPTMIKKAG